jgi:hypothetical protein
MIGKTGHGVNEQESKWRRAVPNAKLTKLIDTIFVTSREWFEI